MQCLTWMLCFVCYCPIQGVVPGGLQKVAFDDTMQSIKDLTNKLWYSSTVQDIIRLDRVSRLKSCYGNISTFSRKRNGCATLWESGNIDLFHLRCIQESIISSVQDFGSVIAEGVRILFLRCCTSNHCWLMSLTGIEFPAEDCLLMLTVLRCCTLSVTTSARSRIGGSEGAQNGIRRGCIAGTVKSFTVVVVHVS